MIKSLRLRLSHTALGPAVVIWGFGYVLVDIFAFLMGRSAPGTNLLASVPMFLLGIGLTLTLDELRQALQSRGWILRWTLLALAVVTATVIQTLFDLYWLRWVAMTLAPRWQEWALLIGLQRVFTVGILYLWTFCLAITLLWAARFSAKFEASNARAARAEAAAAKAEAAALRLQLNPHFLFNTLNSISSLVHLERKHQAEEMIDRLCEFLRASLNADPMADVPLSQEIDGIDAYLDIEATRFGDRLDVRIDVEPGVAETPVPNFLLQPLVENAIKHGVARIKGPAALRVAAARQGGALVLSVLNSLPSDLDVAAEDCPARPSTGIGLANIRQRLANRFGAAASLETGETDEGYRAVIRLPQA
ncbi:histidine kinase [Sphingosinicella sp. LHD-64]|uniref:sensor histidine kinase n=1 Tax=Sphingosinicella sp. LHD-64 TaxID=3072139 RepID=UPI00280C42CD|nr:histidine kinase [Sphingosinicella sp. LHD-64]MDQ8754747.1 histidine kinase [Sphingosinicella sp. LHD-64]